MSATAKDVSTLLNYLRHKMSILRQRLCFSLVAALLLITAHRLPAPIQEVPESPTPEQSAKPRRTIKSKVTNESSESSTKRPASSLKPQSQPTPNRTPFAGTWVGTTRCGIFGNVEFTLTVNVDGSAVNERSSNFGSFTFPTTWDGTTLKWIAHPGFGESTCILTPNPDGQTAQVIMQSPFNDNFAPTYRRQSNSVVAPGPTTQRPRQVEIPTAKPVPEKPGFVYNPFDPTAHRLVDVRGKASGTKVKDPTSGKLFIVP